MCQGLVSRGMSGLPALAPPRPPLSLPPGRNKLICPLPQPVAAFAFVLFAILPLSFLSGVSGDSRRWTTFGAHVGCAWWGLGSELRDATSDSVQDKLKGTSLNRALARDMEARQHDTAKNTVASIPAFWKPTSTQALAKCRRRELLRLPLAVNKLPRLPSARQVAWHPPSSLDSERQAHQRQPPDSNNGHLENGTQPPSERDVATAHRFPHQVTLSC